jgi:Polyketide synthase dehydratase
VHAVQVQGQALMPGAAMFEMAASAAATVADVAATSAAALLRVSIPAPLPLTTHAAAASTLLSCTLDTASGRLTVQSQTAAGGHPRLHLASLAGVAPAVSVPTDSTDQAAVLPSRAAATLQSIRASQHAGGTAIADLQQQANSQAAQYNVPPAVLDCCTQVT